MMDHLKEWHDGICMLDVEGMYIKCISWKLLTMVRKFADQAENIVSLQKINSAACAPAHAGRTVRIFVVMIYDTAQADQAETVC